ncbi:MAG: family 78 glycoside hydrolase catalytic domain [Planctomycetes bacterium]|nr:family 78 glycoside hydrolase catalytic domain [Planctomycetota bacterium]
MLRQFVLLLLLVPVETNLVTLAAIATEPVSPTLKAIDLRCEHLVDPLGIDDRVPRLSWKLAPTAKGLRSQRQSAYRVLVASERLLLDRDRGDLWDSGRVASTQSHLVSYEGQPLRSRVQCLWKVRVWDERGIASDWSPIAQWSMGLLTPDAWQNAKWIGLSEIVDAGVEITDIKSANWLWYPEGNAAFDAPVETRYFRRDITLPTDRRIVRAHCFFAGDDSVQFFVNGALVGIGNGHPSLVGAELTRQLKPGVNELAASITNGNADVPNNPAGWIGALRVEFDRGPPMVLHTDKTWKCVKSADDSWLTADFTGSDWVGAVELGKAGIAPWGIPWKDRWQSEHRRLPGRNLRREFQTQDGKTVRRATAYVSGLGFFDLYVNGRRIGDQLMNPALTGYDKRALYVTFDVTDAIRSGKNVVGVVLSNGRFFAPRVQHPVPMHSYGHPQMIGQIHIEYTDGSKHTIVTDESWKVTSDGPLLASNEFDGEEYDARKEMAGWSAPQFNASAWKPVDIIKPPGGQLEAQMVEPIRVTEVLEPVQILQAKPGIWMIDFGQAFYGVVRLQVSGPTGTRVTMRTSFNVLPDGTLNYINDRSARNTDVYTVNGDGVETWHPRFRGNATRWVQVEEFPGTPTKNNFAGLVTHTDHAPVGEFECSNELVNRVYLNARWGTRLQNRSVPMEPDRDERMPWSGHPAKTSESEGWAFNVARFYEHFLHNYRVHQADDGHMQEILPPYWLFDGRDIIWPSVATIIPDWYYNFYGDDRPLRDNYDMMKRFVLYHEQTNLKPDNTMDHCTYGDWVDTASIGANSRNGGATSRPLMSTAYLYNNCQIVQRAAGMLGNAQDEQYFRELAGRIYVGFNRRFFDAMTGSYESATQCSSVLPLAFGLVPDEHRQRVIDHLVNDILVAHNGHTSVGLIGTQWQMQVLTDIGRPDVAYKIATRTERPSWGYMISKGATTSWERWDTDTQDGGMNGESQKILSGNFEAWCYQTLGGINYDPQRPGFKHIILRPRPVGDLTWTRASHVSVYGKIVSDWKLADGKIHWRVVVPPNATATAYIPTTSSNLVRESGEPIDQTPGIQLIELRTNAAIVELGSGAYDFTAPFRR